MQAAIWQHLVVVMTTMVPVTGCLLAYRWAKSHPGSILYATFFPTAQTGRDLQAGWHLM